MGEKSIEILFEYCFDFNELQILMNCRYFTACNAHWCLIKTGNVNCDRVLLTGVFWLLSHNICTTVNDCITAGDSIYTFLYQPAFSLSWRSFRSSFLICQYFVHVTDFYLVTRRYFFSWNDDELWFLNMNSKKCV